MYSLKPLRAILAISVIVAILHITGCHGRTRYGEGEPCDDGTDCLQGFCCVRMTKWEGNKCRERNKTIGKGCSETHFPLNTDYDAYLGGCPCSGGLQCKMKGRKPGTCQRKP
uniref:Putative secreted protein n=1 Tax=Amblyomma triste TaxID=251400 RepID=A0A023G481_AMBTT